MGFARFARRQMRVHRDRIDTLCSELVFLVFHERDERAHDHSQAGESERQLIDERFSASRRHHDERVASFEQRVDRLPLTFPEITMAEALAQQLANFGFRILH